MSAPLKVYSASAGAGKTFRLVAEYIKLLMLRPDEYKHILAVTFTKKATQEMKMRILSKLYELREGLPSSNDYLEEITKQLDLSEETVRKNAGVALNLILNDFGHFRIETIDSFFQHVLRNMTRELDISSNMRVELNGDQIKDKAIDAMIDGLEPQDHIFMRVLQFAEDNMEEGKDWNIIKSLKTFGKNIFTNFYQSHAKDYKELLKNNPNIFKEYKSNLYAMINLAEQEILANADKLKARIEEHGMSIDLFSRGTLSSLYKNIANGILTKTSNTLNGFAESGDNWLKSTDKKKYSTQVIDEFFVPVLKDILNLQKTIKSCRVIISNLSNIELLGAIEDAVDSSNINANRFLLSSTNQLLSEMIDDSDTPFIYEKIGTQINHLMIDEFQDTSTLQWKNFYHLMKETMSNYDVETAKGTIGSMIVGDIKQSIYRWRDGDWELLGNIKEQFDNEEDTEVIPLYTNYRSEANIINFNNAFFLCLKEINNIQKAYDDVRQEVKPERLENPVGEIEFTMLSPEAYKVRHKMICDKVAELIQKGVDAKDIAILGRGTTILKELSKTFMDFYPDIKVVSKESFQLDASTAVNTIISALRLVQKPQDKILLATLEKHSGIPAEECHKLITDINKTKPLLDIIEDVFTKFNIGQMQHDSAFVSAFFDHVKDFTSKNVSTIRNFLKYWDEQISAKSIETEDKNGVQLMTIHKSKGLEFDNVIIADGAWETALHRNRIWIELKDKPFADIPFTIVTPSKELSETIFKNDYEKEKFQFEIDNINILYVAFTRAGKNLYYYGQTSKGYDHIVTGQAPKNFSYTSKTISGLVERCLDSMQTNLESNTTSEMDSENDKLFHYTTHYGIFAIKEEESSEEKTSKDTSNEKANEEKVNVFKMPVTTQKIQLHLNKPKITFLQSNRSKDFIASLPEAATVPAATVPAATVPEVLTSAKPAPVPEASASVQPASSYISTGLLLHYVLSQINTIQDVDPVLQRLEIEGIISQKSHANLIRKRITENKQAKSWFSPEWTVYNECSILTSEGTRRADRVITNGEETIVIDYKFGNPDQDHKDQVLEYKKLLTEMGFPNVKGFLWYVYSDTIKAV